MTKKSIAKNLRWLWVQQYFTRKEELNKRETEHPLYERWKIIGGDWYFPKWLFKQCIDAVESLRKE